MGCTNPDDVISKLERCTAGSLRWAGGNALRFKTSKMETVLFFRRRKHRHCNRGVRVRSQTIQFAQEAIWWLGIWLDSFLTLAES